ncbi:MAG TPA: glycosyltransferase [Terracidiphilus sp.]|jgi:glycosyltransferase involved in cell wall biosynthesis
MRIAYILTSLAVGGAERQVVWLAQHMARSGHTIQLVVLLPRGEGDWEVQSSHATTQPAIEVVYLGMRRSPWHALQGLVRGASALRHFRPDILHTHNFHGNLAGRLLGLLCHVPVVSTIHNVYEGGWRRMLAYRFTDTLSRRTIAVSEAARERYVRLRAVTAHKADVIANGIETAEFVPDPARRKATREAMGVSEQDFIWITVGRLTPAKDYPNLFRAFAQLSSSETKTVLWIAGYGDAAYEGQLRALAQELGIEPRVHWLGPRRDIAALLNAADGFVLSSAWEGMPLALGEAMAMGKLIAATDVGGVREMTGDIGGLVRAGDSGRLAEMMGRTMALGDIDKAQIGNAARARVLERFSMEAKTREWEEVYRSVQS